MKIALVWDKYTPRVESAIARDLLMLQGMMRVNQQLTVACVGDDPVRLLNALHVQRDTNLADADAWCVYFVKEQPEVPVEVEHVYLRDLVPKQPDAHFRHDAPTGYPVLERPSDFREGKPTHDPTLIPMPNPYALRTELDQ